MTAGTAQRRRTGAAARRPPAPPRPISPGGGARRAGAGGARVAAVRTANIRRRVTFFTLFMVLAFCLVAARITQIQAVSSKRYADLGRSQLLRSGRLPAERGSIFDRDGNDLALSVRQSTVWADPRVVRDPLATSEALAPILAMDPADLQSRLTKDAGFVYLARKVTDDVADKVSALKLPGISLMPESARFLPAGDLAAPVLGMVGTDNEGLSGLEVEYEKRLAGRPGQIIVERNPDGVEVPGGLRQFVPSERGDDLVLTIDRSLQYETERALKEEISKAHAKGGMALVMQVHTGEVLAMANLKTADDSSIGPALSNTAVTNVYEPGSVNKLITISGALEEGIIRPDERLLVPGSIKVADATFREHDPHPTQQWSITDIVANSSNVGSIMIGQRLGKERLDKYLRSYGFGQQTDLHFPGESAGLLLDPKKYSGSSMGTMPIGQGIAVTALQMLAAYNTVANGGVYVAPKLVKATIGTDGEPHPTPPSDTHRVVSNRTALQMTAMLNEVVRVGTAPLAGIDGYTVAGKTGTARKPLENARGYKEGAYISTFAGFVPSEVPELSAIVILDEPTPIFGGLVAAPVFSQIMQYGLRQLRIPPPATIPAAVLAAQAAVPRSTPRAAQGVGEAGDGQPPPPSATTTTMPVPSGAPQPRSSP